jgi:hypothetical protein
MQNLLNKIGLYALFGTILFLLGAWLVWGYMKVEIKRNNDNFKSAMVGMKYSQDSAIAIVKEKIVTKKEFNELFSPLVSKIEDIDLKIKNIKIASYTATEHNNTFTVNVKDTMIFDTIPAEIADYSDKWSDFHYVKPISSKIARVEYHSMDTVFVFYGRDNWKLRNLWSPRDWKWYLKNSNPHNKIVDSQFINIKR